jgi:Tfp pilus assembly protein PilF/predicted transcriptional regulator
VASGASGSISSEVLDYLATFRILLILDNLETVLDRRLREFLERLPHGSKVLITSRIGVGAFENPVRLQSLTPDDAVLLLRALAKSRGVDGLVRTSNKNLAVFCARMKNNPGFIKWFVAAVQAGKRPEDVLAHPDLFLDYCMSTVYDFLSDASRCVLNTMSAVPERHSQAELAYLSDLDYMDIQRSLQQLLSTNMIHMESIPRSASFETRYGLSDLARAYLQKHHPADSRTFQAVNLRKRQMVAATEGLHGSGDCDPYSFYSIQTRSRSDFIVAKYLRDALDAVFANCAPDAELLIDKALGLSPEYFEVHRVAALVYVKAGNYPRAQSAYEAAIELEPKSAPLRAWYGGFLLREMNDPDIARRQFEEALKLDPEAHNVQVEIARCHLYLYRFDEAQALLRKVRDCKDLPNLLARKVSDLLLQVDVRSADFYLGQRDAIKALEALFALRSNYQSLPSGHIDRFIVRTLRKAIPTAIACERALHETVKEGDAKDLCDWLQDFDDTHSHASQGVERPANPLKPAVGDEGEELTLTGDIEKLIDGQPYGFIRSRAGRRLFFHRNSLAQFRDWSAMSVGTPVKFELGSNARGTCAINVVIGE